MVEKVLRDEFIKRAYAAALQARREGAKILPTVAAAQAALESNFGRSKLALQCNNLFGVKAGKTWTGASVVLPTQEWDKARGRMVSVACRWKAYDSWVHCFQDYAAILSRLSWYSGTKKAAADNDFEAFLTALCAAEGKPGWATDPNYSAKIRTIALQYNLIGGV